MSTWRHKKTGVVLEIKCEVKPSANWERIDAPAPEKAEAPAKKPAAKKKK